MAWTNLGKQKMFEEFFCSGAVDATFRLCLVTSAGTWDASTADTSAYTVVSSLPGTDGNGDSIGGASGLVVLRDSVGDGANFDVSSADDLGGGGSAVRAVLQTGGDAFQFSGAFNNEARYVILASAGAQGSDFDFGNGSENIYAWWNIGSQTDITAGNTLTITSLSLQGQ